MSDRLFTATGTWVGWTAWSGEGEGCSGTRIERTTRPRRNALGRPNRLAAFAFWLAVYPPANNSRRRRFFAISLPSPRPRVHFPVSFRRPFGTVYDVRPCGPVRTTCVSPHKRFASRVGRKESPRRDLNSKFESTTDEFKRDPEAGRRYHRTRYMIIGF